MLSTTRTRAYPFSKDVWGLYGICKRKAVILVCDNTAYVKMLSGIANQMTEAETGIPYESAKLHYILDVEHKDFLIKIVRQLEMMLPYPKEKAKKRQNINFTSHPFCIFQTLDSRLSKTCYQWVIHLWILSKVKVPMICTSTNVK